MARHDAAPYPASRSDHDTIEVEREMAVDRDDIDQTVVTKVEHVKSEATSRSHSPLSKSSKFQVSRSSSSSRPGLSRTKSDMDDTDVKSEEDRNGHDPRETKLPRPSKATKSGKKSIPRVAPRFDDLADATHEANRAYQVIDACIYQNKFLGYTEHAMECDCQEEWNSSTKTNGACGEDSDCINRATKMECVGDCACGPACQNQRFLRRLYANVSVIKTEKKGYGLRTDTDLKNGDFIYEYIGEVIPEGTFRKRMRQYDDEGIKHFYFMSLTKGEFVDATKKGNLGRFCNHSCNPNCYVDKWVVGDKLRMGIFAERSIKAGEELVFNYNVDRYGANPQPCYCGEDNCTGFIGGKTQTEKGTKLSAATIEALGIDDEDWDAWDTVVAKRPKKKKASDDDDEDYVERAEVRTLDTNGVTKVMAALMQCKEKWIAVKLLQRLQSSDNDDVYHRIVKLHGYRILNSQLSAWQDDDNVIIQILDVLHRLPRLTRNKIVDAKIDQTLEPLKGSQDERVAHRASLLLEEWSKLELAYRIPRKVRTTDDSTDHTPVKYERRDSAQVRRRSRSRSKTPPRGPAGVHAPTGPRGVSSRPLPFTRPVPSTFSRGPPPLPAGWFQATDDNNRVYFYSATGETTWKRPSQPAAKPPPPPKAPSQQDMLKSIIDGIVTSSDKPKDTRNSTPDTPDAEAKDVKKEKWRSLTEDKQKKLYENTLYPHISHVVNKYKHKIPKDDLKRFAKDIAKKLVNADYNGGKVSDPTKIDEKKQKKIKAYCTEFFDRAAKKHQQMEEDRAARKMKQAEISHDRTPTKVVAAITDEAMSDGDEAKMSHDGPDYMLSPSETNHSLKRKRSVDMDTPVKDEEDDPTMSPPKKLNSDTGASLSIPPPPPPPPAPHDFETTVDVKTDIHADTNFKKQSMADVLAQAQQENGDGEVDDEMAEDTAADGLHMENPLVDERVLMDRSGTT